MKTTLYKLSLSALSGLNRLRHRIAHYDSKCYNAVAISSIDLRQAYLNFEKADEAIKAMELIPVNPMTLHPDNLTWLQYMVLDIKELIFCGSIYVQSNYKQSKGAKLELAFAKLTRKTIIYQTK